MADFRIFLSCVLKDFHCVGSDRDVWFTRLKLFQQNGKIIINNFLYAGLFTVQYYLFTFQYLSRPPPLFGDNLTAEVVILLTDIMIIC